MIFVHLLCGLLTLGSSLAEVINLEIITNCFKPVQRQTKVNMHVRLKVFKLLIIFISDLLSLKKGLKITL